jgi:hypothetical protein
MLHTQAKNRRNAAGQHTRMDEAAPSADYLAKSLAAGEVRAAKSMARQRMDFRGGWEILPGADCRGLGTGSTARGRVKEEWSTEKCIPQHV